MVIKQFESKYETAYFIFYIWKLILRSLSSLTQRAPNLDKFVFPTIKTKIKIRRACHSVTFYVKNKFKG